MATTRTDMDSIVTIQGETFSVGSVWGSFVGDQSVAAFLANDDRPVAEQCQTYAAWAATNMASDDDDAPAWTDDDTATLADALERSIAFEQAGR